MNGDKEKILGKTSVQFKIREFETRTDFYVIPGIDCKVILGCDFINKNVEVINMKTYELVFIKENRKFRVSMGQNMLTEKRPEKTIFLG